MEMGQTQTQQIDNFISDQINTNVIAQVISRYATQTNAITTNQQNVEVDLSGCTISGTVNAGQYIKSSIDVRQMLDRVDKASLSNDLQKAISTQLENAIERYTDGLNFSLHPDLLEARNRVLNEVNTYVNQVVNTSTLDTLLLSASNYQNGKYNLRNCTIGAGGVVNITQDLQSNIMADNIIKQVMDRLIQNKDVLTLNNAVQNQLKSENVSPITTAVTGLTGIIGKNINTWIFYIAGIIILILGIILAVVVGYLVPTKIWLAVVIGVTSLVLAVILFIIGFIQGRAASA